MKRNEEQQAMFDEGYRLGKAFANTPKDFSDISRYCDLLIELQERHGKDNYFWHVQAGYACGKANEEHTDYHDSFLRRR